MLTSATFFSQNCYTTKTHRQAKQLMREWKYPYPILFVKITLKNPAAGSIMCLDTPTHTQARISTMQFAQTLQLQCFWFYMGLLDVSSSSGGMQWTIESLILHGFEQHRRYATVPKPSCYTARPHLTPKCEAVSLIQAPWEFHLTNFRSGVTTGIDTSTSAHTSTCTGISMASKSWTISGTGTNTSVVLLPLMAVIIETALTLLFGVICILLLALMRVLVPIFLLVRVVLLVLLLFTIGKVQVLVLLLVVLALVRFMIQVRVLVLTRLLALTLKLVFILIQIRMFVLARILALVLIQYKIAR